MSLYSDSPYPVEDELASIHARRLDQLAEPGTLGTGSRRLNDYRSAANTFRHVPEERTSRVV